MTDLRRKLAHLVLLGIVSFGIGLLGQSQTSGNKEANLTPAQRKIAPLVRDALARMKTAGIDRSNAASFNAAQQYSSPLLRVDNSCRIQLYLDLRELNGARLSILAATGDIEVEIANENLKRLQAWVPCDKIEAVAALDFVVRIRPPDYGRVRTGSKNSQGDTILKADQVRITLGITGAGVKVGVISDGANNFTSAQASGDLPTPITIFGSCNPALTESTCNEGTAMMEIVHDLAPSAILAMGDSSTSLDFIQRVTDLKNWGAKIIVDDVGFPGQPYFEDGNVAASYASALSQGIVMVSAAGNDAESHYQGLFVQSSFFPGYGFAHDFGGGDITMNFTTGSGSTTVVLQWSNQFGHSADDYDLCITDATGTLLITCSVDPQDGTQDPIEAVHVTCGSSVCSGNVRITKYAGTAQTLELFLLGPQAKATEFGVPGDSIFGHPAVPGVISVGAINASNPGNTTIEAFSSRGPSTIFFPSFQQRSTPSLTTVDCVSVTGAGGFPSTFCGTSAAAPHAAAVAALLLEAAPSLMPSQVAAAMQNTASDRGTSGFDNTFGAGLVDAFSAVSSVLNPSKKRRGQITSVSLSTPGGKAWLGYFALLSEQRCPVSIGL